jgi:hypothetical protein
MSLTLSLILPTIMLPCTICPNIFLLLLSVVSVYCRCDCLLVEGAVGALALTHGTLGKHFFLLLYLLIYFILFVNCICCLRSSRKRDATLSIIPFFVSLQQLLHALFLVSTKYHGIIRTEMNPNHDTNSMRTNHFRKQLACGGGTNL